MRRIRRSAAVHLFAVRPTRLCQLLATTARVIRENDDSGEMNIISAVPAAAKPTCASPQEYLPLAAAACSTQPDSAELTMGAGCQSDPIHCSTTQAGTQAGRSAAGDRTTGHHFRPAVARVGRRCAGPAIIGSNTPDAPHHAGRPAGATLLIGPGRLAADGMLPEPWQPGSAQHIRRVDGRTGIQPARAL
jgi:hypothetical protein